MAGPTARFKGACIGRKLPRTPFEYAELKRTARAVEFSWGVNNDVAPAASNELEPPRMPPKVGTPHLDDISESSNIMSGASENDEGIFGCQSYIVILHDDTVGDIKQENVKSAESAHPGTMDVDEGTSQGVCPATRSGDKKGEKLNPAAMDSFGRSGTTGHEKLNKVALEPQIYFAKLDSKSIAMHFDEGASQNACPVTRYDFNTSEYEKLNPETMDSYQGSATTGHVKLNKATMEPQTCSANLDGTSMCTHLDEGTSQSACPMARSDDRFTGYEKVNPETMDSNQGSATTGYEKLNKATMEPRTCSARLDGTSMSTHLDEGTSQSACPVARSDNKSTGYEKLNPETMDSYQESATAGYEKLNKATMEPQTCSTNLDGTSTSTHLDEGTSQSAFPVARSDDKSIGYEKLNPEMMDSYQGSATTGYEKFNKATMEPQTCSSDLDSTSMKMYLDEQTLPCLEIISDDKKGHCARLDSDTMDQGSNTTGYEKLNKATTEP